MAELLWRVIRQRRDDLHNRLTDGRIPMITVLLLQHSFTGVLVSAGLVHEHATLD